ncbi:MAG: PmoA family protein [Patescibacteria group bacterium]|nr:PmoA family protein [Patescibacteria group bacterium]
MKALPMSLILFALLVAVSHPLPAQVTAEKSEKGVVVKIDGKPFTEYLTEVDGKPILWPIIGPTGKPMTRAFPMIEDIEGERHDHPHQASFWFTHAEVNGSNFWSIKAKEDILGTTRHGEFRRIDSGKAATIVTVNDWIGHDGRKVLEDERVIEFGTIGDSRYIDFTITLKATEGPVTFGDTKEGTFGVRVAATMKVDAKLGGKIVNSEGQTDLDAWGRPAAWVDYHGPVEGETVGIAILNHPSSFRFPTPWHVRTYGLFAANPFGLSDFPDPVESGEYTLKRGEDMTLRYRVIFHRGTEKDADIASLFNAYAGKQ